MQACPKPHLLLRRPVVLYLERARQAARFQGLPPQGGWSASFVRGRSRPPHGQPGVCEQRDAIEIHDGSGEGAVATFIRTGRHLAAALAFASERARVEGAIVAADD